MHEEHNHHSGCLVCGQPLVYGDKESLYNCEICKRPFSSSVACENGHYICDDCHSGGLAEIMALLLNSTEQNPLTLLQQIMELPAVHMHGPEHHSIIPFVLLTAYYNNGGNIDLKAGLQTALKRGSIVPGGFCGFWGVCGAAVAAGIYASIVIGSHPLNAEKWGLPQLLSSRCLQRNAEIGGPRCCKRTSRIAVELAASFTREHLGVSMPTAASPCAFSGANKECLHQRCPYFAG